MSFRLPVPERTVLHGSFLGKIKESGQITFFRELKTNLLLADSALKVSLHPLVVAEFIVPLAYMNSAAKTFADSGIISPEKHFRLMVAESLSNIIIVIHYRQILDLSLNLLMITNFNCHHHQ
jgi:hypothetical protein